MVATILLVVNVITGDVSPWQKNWLAGWLTCPEGFTVILNCFVGPSQVLPPLVKCGVITMSAITGDEPVFVAVNMGIEPLPEPERPIEVWLFVQV